MPRTSRHRFRGFKEAYQQRRLDDDAHGAVAKAGETKGVKGWLRPGQRRTYLRSYFDWLKPHRYAVAGVFALAVITAGLQMVEPLFMRFIVDKVLLDQTLTNIERIS